MVMFGLIICDIVSDKVGVVQVGVFLFIIVMGEVLDVVCEVVVEFGVLFFILQMYFDFFVVFYVLSLSGLYQCINVVFVFVILWVLGFECGVEVVFNVFYFGCLECFIVVGKIVLVDGVYNLYVVCVLVVVVLQVDVLFFGGFVCKDMVVMLVLLFFIVFEWVFMVFSDFVVFLVEFVVEYGGEVWSNFVEVLCFVLVLMLMGGILLVVGSFYLVGFIWEEFVGSLLVVLDIK